MLHRLIALVAVAFHRRVRNRIADNDRQQRRVELLDRGFFGIDLLQFRLVRLVRFFIEQFKQLWRFREQQLLFGNHRQGIR